MNNESCCAKMDKMLEEGEVIRMGYEYYIYGKPNFSIDGEEVDDCTSNLHIVFCPWCKAQLSCTHQQVTAHVKRWPNERQDVTGYLSCDTCDKKFVLFDIPEGATIKEVPLELDETTTTD